MTDAVWDFALRLPRNAFTECEVPRAGDVWRLCQDAATLASIGAGWPPARFRAEKVAFIVYRMTMLHDRPAPFGTLLDVRTWVSRFRRRTLSTREVRVRDGSERVAAATQEWVHVDFETLKPKQGSPETETAFPAVDVEPSIELPGFDPQPGAETELRFEMWQTWADPLAHANHPAYVDWCDEATSRHMQASGLDPSLLRPIAERITFRNAVLPGEMVIVSTRRIGAIGTDAVVLGHELRTARGAAADAVTVRGLQKEGGGALIAAWD